MTLTERTRERPVRWSDFWEPTHAISEPSERSNPFPVKNIFVPILVGCSFERDPRLNLRSPHKGIDASTHCDPLKRPENQSIKTKSMTPRCHMISS